jgi:hypothetical protein
MGNVVVGQALRQGMSISHYALLHAATSASCYSNAISAYPATNNYAVPDNDADSSIKSMGYTGYLGGIGGGMVNFYDQLDGVITSAWNFNNSNFKPQILHNSFGITYGAYYYNPNLAVNRRIGVNLDYGAITRPIDSFEAKAYVDQSLTGSVGSMTSIAGSVSVKVPEDVFGNRHSYEWDNPLQNVNVFNFYNSLMDELVVPRYQP